MLSDTRLHLLTLPPEIRQCIYELILAPSANRHALSDEYVHYKFAPALVLFKINRQIYYESRKLFHQLNHFVQISTPWPEARNHVRWEGHVPIVAQEEKAAAFTQYTMEVKIDAPEQSALNLDFDVQRFIVHLDDLEKFCRMWFFADLSHPGLNPHLRLTLRLQDPITPDFDEKRILKSVQKRLFEPFAKVKDLADVVITGDPKPYPSVERDLRAAMAEPHASPEVCLSEATRLKDLGNVELQEKRYRNAVDLYQQAWLAMHVVIYARARHIHADAYFSCELKEPFAGQHGQTVRLVLRVRLVANTILAYLKMEKWEEARFWGMRSINMLKEAMGADAHADLRAEDEAVLGFPAANEMGKVYYRTALACKELDGTSEARKLLRVAAVYLPRDEHVKKEIHDCALRIG